MKAPSNTPPIIMVVDDTPANLYLLEKMLSTRGYSVRVFPSGRLALAAANIEPPDLILLDIMMPEMNGYQVCKQLKETATLRDIPVLFISALTGADEKTQAFEAGGVDYVTKPFQAAEVQARVATHLELARDRRELAELVDLRTQQLEEAQRIVQLETLLHHAQKMEAIGHLAAGIAHEINTPMQFIRNNVLFFQDVLAKFGNLLAFANRLLQDVRPGTDNTAVLARFEEMFKDTDMVYFFAEAPGALLESLQGIDRVAEIISSMRDFSHPGAVDMELSDINDAIASTLTICRNEWKKVAEVATCYDSKLPPVWCFPGEIKQALLNIIVNASQAIAEVVGDGTNGRGKITITTTNDTECVEIRIGDTGPGIPETVGNRVFDLFFTTKEVGKGTGQGLAIAHSIIVKKHNGCLAFQSEVGRGATFIIRLPIKSSEQIAPKQR